MKFLHMINAALAAALIVLSLYVYPDLPARIPLHFGVDGTPDRWGSRSLLSWMTLPLLGLGAVALMYVIGAVIPTRPHLMNIPDRKKLLDLPPALQRWVLAEAALLLYGTAFAMLLTFALVQYGAYQSAITGAKSSAVVAGVIVGIAATPLVVIVSLVRIQRRMDAAWREYRVKGDAATLPY